MSQLASGELERKYQSSSNQGTFMSITRSNFWRFLYLSNTYLSSKRMFQFVLNKTFAFTTTADLFGAEKCAAEIWQASKICPITSKHMNLWRQWQPKPDISCDVKECFFLKFLFFLNIFKKHVCYVMTPQVKN